MTPNHQLTNTHLRGAQPLPHHPTGAVDYLVDALALHDSLGQLLGPLLADPRVLKVMHGCANDISWLQQLGCYLVNVFDTEKAAQVGVERGVAQ
jgi:ribonuclease D